LWSAACLALREPARKPKLALRAIFTRSNRFMSGTMARKIILLSDGTGNSAGQVWRTNVWRTFESLDLEGSDQVAFYDDGVGTSSFKPLAILGGVFGYGLKRNVIDIYAFVCRNYRTAEDYAREYVGNAAADGDFTDDDIFGFGFSRGAFTIRVVTGLLLNQGLVRAETEPELQALAAEAYRAYRREKYYTVLGFEKKLRSLRDRLGKSSYDKTKNTTVKHIRFLGLWDTVAAYGLPIDEMTEGVNRWIWPLELPSRTLHKDVRRACHALAADEERQTFQPVLWDEKLENPSLTGLTKDERISQVWFAGVHSNVGGGYPDDTLAMVPLYWMMTEAEACDLKFKKRPHADPDALVHAQSSKDKDGRLYDSRSGVGGYYRYGPRKIFDLCHRKATSGKDDAVLIDRPKIHESLLQRIDVGAHAYAPAVLPMSYEVVTQQGAIVPSTAYESDDHSNARSQLQEAAWNVVWFKKGVYFATLAVTFFILLYPLLKKTPSAWEITTRLRPLADLIHLLGTFLPGVASTWIKAYQGNPGYFLSLLLVLGLLIYFSSELAGDIRARMQRIWKAQYPAPTSPLLPTDWVYRMRSSDGYIKTLAYLKHRFVPGFFAILFVVAGAMILNHVAFLFWDAAGLVCPETAKDKLVRMKPGDKLVRDFATNELCHASGIFVEQNGRYRFTVDKTVDWKDGDSIPSTVGGYHINDVPGRLERIETFLLAPFKRVWIRPFFRFIARTGSAGSEENFLDPDDHPENVNQLQERYTARKDGELFFYVNDGVIALPYFDRAFYSRNQGGAKITVERF
jgi:uncharacterized protein (DUF2235 family)